MRALCASIITAGALIGLGLAGVGLGIRYQALGGANLENYVRFRHLDTGLMLILVVLLAAVIAGLAATFLGLAYHHERRHHERHHRLNKSDSLGAQIGE